ncbi:MAG: RNA 2',3'-cyclic phosphodiesterase, partial [Betaproteobacteria bacterium]|nr:RNA 2',3'-cyclic phosphodiesterase [Betaproteobacteria bacterium]
PDRIHLTLAFLGDADPDEARATAAAVRLPGCAFAIEQARYWVHNRIVWVGPAETPAELSALAEVLGEERGFAAHVTLLRKARPAALPPVPALEWPVPEFVLVGSRLSAEGPSYEVLGRYALG